MSKLKLSSGLPRHETENAGRWRTGRWRAGPERPKRHTARNAGRPGRARACATIIVDSAAS